MPRRFTSEIVRCNGIAQKNVIDEEHVDEK
jgi:hypothetical protein